MWAFLASFTLRYRVGILMVLGLITVFMAYKATQVKLDYNLPRLLPETDTVNQDYEKFMRDFGSHGNVIVLGIQDENIYKLANFNALFEMGNAIKEIPGVEGLISIAHVYNLTKNDPLKKFEFKPIVTSEPQTQAELDSIMGIINSLPFYDGVIYNKNTGAILIPVTLNKDLINTGKRMDLVYSIRDKVEEFEAKHDIKVKFSGLPYIRTGITVLLQREIEVFTLFAAALAAIILFLFFRSFKVVAISLLIVAISVVWSIGSMSLFGFMITGLSGLIPPLLIVIGMENFIFILNKYHQEFRSHGNKIKALTKVVQKIGSATFMTNATTAVGFGTFIPTNSEVLVHFGIIAALNIILVFVLTILLAPIIFSYFGPPKERHIRHLDYKYVGRGITIFTSVVNNRRQWVYFITTTLILASIFGITKMETTGNLIDDLPQNDPARVDLKFFEDNFGGVMPFEILIDTRKKRGVMNLATIKKMDQLNNIIATYPEFASPVSLTEVVKFSKQAFYNGNKEKYSLPNQQEINFILPYASKQMDNDKLIHSIVDSTKQIARISVRMADVGTIQMDSIKNNLKSRIDTLFSPDKYNVTITGTSIVFLEGTKYLVRNLFGSLALTVFLISLIMGGMFFSFRMVIVSLIPNLIPLLLTAAIMGYFGIPIKPSTILVFSIALGISVDNTIHFLAKYRQELKLQHGNIRESVTIALREAGVSIIYSSTVLVFGFGIFIFSDFGGTQALGLLVTITLLLAVLTNLLLLPSLLLSLEKSLTTKAFKEPMIEIFDEEVDIDLEYLKIEGKNPSVNQSTHETG